MAALAAVLTDTAALSHDRLPSERSRPTRLPAPRADRARHTASWRRAERADGCDGARCRRWTLQHRADTAALSHDRLPSDRSRPTRPGRSGPPACLRPAPQGPGERMRVRSTGAAAALGVAPRGAPRCCRPHQSVRSTLEPSPCRRAPLPTRTRSSAVACSGSSGCGGESQFEVSEWLVARVGICCTAAAEQH